MGIWTQKLKFSEKNIRWKNSDCGTRIFWTGIINGNRIPACMEKERNASMSDLEFLLNIVRTAKIIRCISHYIHRKTDFVQAPTGVGKTMSTIFPAVSSWCRTGENIFYLTAKTITRTVAEEAFFILKEHGLKFKVITITAKEKLCFCDKTECNPENCLWARGHLDRVNDAVFELWTCAGQL